MANKTLRELAKAHALGELDKETYRKSRAELIQGIVSATIPLLQIEYPPLVQPPEPEALDDTQRKDDLKKPPVKNEPATATSPAEAKKTARPANHAAGPNRTGSNKMLIISLAVAIVAVIILALIALSGGGTSEPANTSNSVSAENAADSIAAPQTRTQAQTLIQNFLDKNNWSSSSLDDFLQQWDGIAAGDMLASRGSLEMGQLTNAIYKQLLEEQALSGLVDDDSSLIKQEQLVQFAAELGIDDPRIRLPE